MLNMRQFNVEILQRRKFEINVILLQEYQKLYIKNFSITSNQTDSSSPERYTKANLFLSK